MPYTRREEEEEEEEEEAEAPCICKPRCKRRVQSTCGKMHGAGTVRKGKRGWWSSSASSASSARTRWPGAHFCAARAPPQAILVMRFDEGVPSA